MRLVAAASLVAAALARPRWPRGCTSEFGLPPAPVRATDLNGIELEDVCFNESGEHHVFVVGDWGGILEPSTGVVMPADRTDIALGQFRTRTEGVDDQAQQRVASQMAARAFIDAPDFILNVGDNFYWGGLEGRCGDLPPNEPSKDDGQWKPIFEEMYTGIGIEGKAWLSVLGNHDYGGFSFLSAWDQQIGYTWGGEGSTGRWIMPGQYWKVKVWYPDFNVDFYFVDTNVFDTRHPQADGNHNICSLAHNPYPATCGPQGPVSTWDCPQWFASLWDDEIDWLERHLRSSLADWQVVVTHFPPTWGLEDWTGLSTKYGIDLIVTGHIHSQHVFGPEDLGNPIRPTAYIVSGGGGGITSEGQPDDSGMDDEYGFMDLVLSKDEIAIHAISHGGIVRSITSVARRPRQLHHPWKHKSYLRRGGQTKEVQEMLDAEAAAKAMDPERLPRCDGTAVCPGEWLTGGPGIGGYYCPPPTGSGQLSGGCRNGDVGPFSVDFCPRQCFIGDPPVKSFSTTTKTSTTTTTSNTNTTTSTHTTSTATSSTSTLTTTTTTTRTFWACDPQYWQICPQIWATSHEPMGYLCVSSRGCRPLSIGPFAPGSCPDQCLLGGTTTTTWTNTTTTTYATKTSTITSSTSAASVEAEAIMASRRPAPTATTAPPPPPATSLPPTLAPSVPLPGLASIAAEDVAVILYMNAEQDRWERAHGAMAAMLPSYREKPARPRTQQPTPTTSKQLVQEVV